MRARREQQHNSNKKKNETLIHFLFCSSSAAARFVNYDTNTHNKFHIISKAINEKFTFFFCCWFCSLRMTQKIGRSRVVWDVQQMVSCENFVDWSIFSHKIVITHIRVHGFISFCALWFTFLLLFSGLKWPHWQRVHVHHSPFFSSTQWSIN